MLHKFLHFSKKQSEVDSEINNDEEDEMQKIEAESDWLDSFKQQNPVPLLANHISFHKRDEQG